MVYFESSAVCTSSITDAAVRTAEGEIFIARNFFIFVDRNEATVGRAFAAQYNVIPQEPSTEVCGSLIDAPWVELDCLQPAE